jgi:hypothetical protein
MKYLLIVDQNREKFEQQVSQALEKGWNLAGGVQVKIINNELYYFQSIYAKLVEKRK